MVKLNATSKEHTQLEGKKNFDLSKLYPYLYHSLTGKKFTVPLEWKVGWKAKGSVDNEWFRNCSQTFFKPLMDIIKPRGILALGKQVSESILTLYDVQYSKHATLSKIMEQSPYRLTKSTVLFPLYHCGAGGINRNRSMSRQKEDWRVVYKWLQNN